MQASSTTDPAKITITVSVGATLATAGTGSNIDVLTAADEALYQAKEAGRDRVCFKRLECKTILPTVYL